MTETGTSQGDRNLADATLAEHRDGMRPLAEIEECLDQHPDREGVWLGRVRECLPRLAQTMRDHFRGETGMYRDLPEKFPRFAERLDKLEAEHKPMLESVTGLVEQARQLNDPAIHQLRELNGRIQLLVATLRRHEAEENEIVLSAYWDEVGTGD